MSIFILVLIYICRKIWLFVCERWEFQWPYRGLFCCNNSNVTNDSLDDDAEGNEVLCYLCNRKVPISEWNNSETGHRRYCAVRSKDNRGNKQNLKYMTSFRTHIYRIAQMSTNMYTFTSSNA